MASSTKKQKVQDTKCSREFKTWWAEKYGMINKGDKAVCVLCSGVCKTSSVKRHFETNHRSFCEKSEPEQKELIASAIKDRNKQSTSMFKYVRKNCHTSAASYSAANAIARHGKSFQEGVFEGSLVGMCALTFDDFDNKDKIIQRIKDVPLSRNTMKDRILKLAENVTDQQKMTLTPLFLYRYVLTKKRYYYKKLQVLPKLEKKNIKDLDAQEKRNEEKVIDDFISIMDSLIKEFSARFSQFKELSETFKFIMYPDVISFDKLNLSQFDW
ncbi:uncharacterized protein TNCV_2040001 [Trichonephila clavipes]|nr:uncharacterized protein TNCV_2040001 [Trichonephila clavipes]